MPYPCAGAQERVLSTMRSRVPLRKSVVASGMVWPGWIVRRCGRGALGLLGIYLGVLGHAMPRGPFRLESFNLIALVAAHSVIALRSLSLIDDRDRSAP